MADPNDRKDEELDVDEQKVSDIDVPEDDAEEAKGGMMAEVKGGTVTGTGCRNTVSIRRGCA